MNASFSRRDFIRRSLVAAALGATAGRLSAGTYAANERLNIGVIGVAHRGRNNLNGVAHHNLVALCDVDAEYLAGARSDFPRSAPYSDYRRMLDRNDLDAVVVSTTDHTHAIMAVSALNSGRHVYCEKPLARTISEVRAMQDAARRSGKVTQMGNQIHASNNYRRVVELVQSGAIGPIREAHHWVGQNPLWWDPTDSLPLAPPPENLEWDLWLGPAEERPFSPSYAPRSWRRFWDFAGGSLADMGAHHMDLSFWALDLDAPRAIVAEGPALDPQRAPEWLAVRYDFPARGRRPAVRVHWYHGGRKPPQITAGEVPDWSSGTLFVGAKGMILSDYNRHLLLPERDFAGFTPPKPSIPESVGHHEEWLQACLGRGKASCNFDYAAPLTETVLLGNVAYRAGGKLEWNSRSGRASPGAQELLQHRYRKGWTL